MNPTVPQAGRQGATAPPASVTVVGPSETPSSANPITESVVKQDHTGQTLGDFRLVRRLGEGGMGQVYLADQTSLHRRVAIKVLRSDFADNATFLKRFEAEAKAIAQLTHPNIVQVYSVGNAQGIQYMALEYVDGTNLKDYLNRKGPPELPIALAIMRQIAAALMKAAELGIIHRDIKPENILLTRKVEVKVADFGLSRMVDDDVHLTQTGTTMGTPLYMSPEQITGKAVDPRSDLYSFGATCYHLLTGQPPFMADSAMAVGVRHLTDPPKPIAELRPDLPADLCNLVHRLLAKKADDRPQTAREVLREIRRIQDALAGNTVPSMSKTVPTDLDDDPLEFGAAVTKSLPMNSEAVDAKNKRKWLVPLVGASVVVAIGGGAIIGMMLRNEGHTASRPISSSTRPDSRKALNSGIGAIEKALKQKVEETRYQRDPNKPADPFPIEKMLTGVEKRAELMRYYVLNLDEKDESVLQRARQFAEHEAQAAMAPEPYKAVGMIGQAVLLAYEAKPKESYDMLAKAFALRNSAAPKRALQTQMFRNKDIVELISLALTMNEERMPLPEDLKVIKEDLERGKRGVPPDKNRQGKTS